jgi:hypothetical protein
VARGQILNIPTNTGTLVTTLSREMKASLSLLNPNDGICYVKLNGEAQPTPSLWDWKVPSQSYCQLPGPWDSLGVYYVDQSGSGRTAEVNVYELDSQISVPSFIAIGRAVQQAGSAVDISQGTQPSNPPASSMRLWADGSGNLHILSSTGVDKTLIDSSTPLGGDLYGTIPVSHIGIRYGQTVGFYDTGGTLRPGIGVMSNGTVLHYASGGSGFLWSNQNNTAALMSVDSNGAFSVPSDITSTSGNIYASNGSLFAGVGHLYLGPNAGSPYLFYSGGQAGIAASGGVDWIVSSNLRVAGQAFVGSSANPNQAGDLGISRNAAPTTGVIYFGNTAIHYLYYDGINFQLANTSLMIGGNALYLANSSTVYFQWNGSAVVHSHPILFPGATNNPNAYLSFPSTNGLKICIFDGGASNYYGIGANPAELALVTSSGSSVRCRQGNISGADAPLVCSALTQTSNLKLKSDIVPIENALDIVLNEELSGWHYTINDPEVVRDFYETLPPVDYRYGFIAQHWEPIVPDVVTHDIAGELIGMDYSQVLSILFQAFKQYVVQINDRLTKLESNLPV